MESFSEVAEVVKRKLNRQGMQVTIEQQKNTLATVWAKDEAHFRKWIAAFNLL